MEEDDHIEDEVDTGVKFNVKYLGSSWIQEDIGEEEATSAAIKEILNKAKEKNKKLPRVSLNISEKGIIMKSLSDGCDEINMDIKIHR